MHARRRDEVTALKAFEVGFHLPEQPRLLSCCHGWQRGDDHLGVLEFDQVMKLNARLLVARVVAVEDGVAAGLDLVGVGDLFRVGGG